MQNISSTAHSVAFLHQQHSTMNLQEAQKTISKLASCIGRTMQPFNSPVKDFLVLPANQQDFSLMLKEMTDNNAVFDKAITPYQNNVTVLVCPDELSGMDSLNHCTLDYFLRVNNIQL